MSSIFEFETIRIGNKECEVFWQNGEAYCFLEMGNKNKNEFVLKVKPLGKGSYGTVYEGYLFDKKTNQIDTEPKAVKVYHNRDKLDVQAIKQEAENQNWYYPTEFYEDKDIVITVMPKLPGKDLNDPELIDQINDLSLEERFELLGELMRTIAAFHRKRPSRGIGLNHTDLKAANFLFDIKKNQKTRKVEFGCYPIDFANESRTPATTAPEYILGVGMQQTLEMETYSLTNIVALTLGAHREGLIGRREDFYHCFFNLDEMDRYLRKAGEKEGVQDEIKKVISMVHAMCDDNPAQRPTDFMLEKVFLQAKKALQAKKKHVVETMDENKEEIDQLLSHIENGNLSSLANSTEFASFAQSDDNLALRFFVKAIGYGQYVIAKYLLEQVCPEKRALLINARDRYGRTLLHRAVLSSNAQAAKFLIEQGAEVGGVDNNGRSLLHLAVLNKNRWNEALIDLLLKQPMNKIKPDGDGRSPLYCAISLGCPASIIKKLIAATPFELKEYVYYLRLAAATCDYAVVNSLLEKLATNGLPDKSKMSQGTNSVPGIVRRQLNSRNMNLDKKEVAEKSQLLHFAAKGGNADLIQAILEDSHFQGIDLNQLDQRKWTPLDYAVDLGQVNACKILLEKDPAKSEKLKSLRNTSRGFSILDIAIMQNNFEAAQFFLQQNKTMLNKLNGKGATPLHIAIELGDANAVGFLLKQGADPNCKDKKGNTALAFAEQCGNTAIITLLNEKRVDSSNSTNKGRCTALDMSRENKLEQKKKTSSFTHVKHQIFSFFASSPLPNKSKMSQSTNPEQGIVRRRLTSH